MNNWPKEMNETEIQLYHRSAHSLPVAFRLACRRIDRLTTENIWDKPEPPCDGYKNGDTEYLCQCHKRPYKPEPKPEPGELKYCKEHRTIHCSCQQREIDRLTTKLAKPHFGMADARAEALTKQIAAWTAEVALANDNLRTIQTAKERRLEAELEHYRKRAIEFSNDVKKVEAELAESKTLTEIACSLLEDADAENKRLREALKPIYEHCKNNMQICGIVEQAKAALKGE